MSAVFEKPELKESYFIYTFERGVNIGKDAWIRKNKADGKEVTDTTPAKLNNDLRRAIQDNKECIVIIHAHGASPSISTQKGLQQSIYLKNLKPVRRNQFETDEAFDEAYMEAHEAARMTGVVFADYLIDQQKLPPEVKELRFFACYTDDFAERVAKRLGERGYSNTTVVGYKGEFSIYQGVNGTPIAGLDPDLTPELYNEKQEVNWDELTEEIQEKYAADAIDEAGRKKYEKSFNSSTYFKQKNEEENIKESLVSNLPPTSSTSHYASATAIPPSSLSSLPKPSVSTNAQPSSSSSTENLLQRPQLPIPTSSLSRLSNPSAITIAQPSTNSSTDYSEERVRQGTEEGKAAAEAHETTKRIERETRQRQRELQPAERSTQEVSNRNRSASPKKQESDKDSSPSISRTPSPRPGSSS